MNVGKLSQIREHRNQLDAVALAAILWN